ncbi:MAG: hypothetical protein KGL39_14975 [Patescibacteria group bacterium]|nr:hypothetical protein [Patescibacteria group bacterium]
MDSVTSPTYASDPTTYSVPSNATQTTGNFAVDALELIRREKTAWDVGVAFVTDKVAFQMRNVIRQMRKNYWGVFEEPNDPMTGRRKIWPPLTEYMVEAAIKNIDLDLKDISLRAKNSSAQPLAIILRQAVHNYLEKINFGEMLDVLERQAAIDGTAVWKTWEETGTDGKKRLCVKLVDLLNFYIDPTVDNIREAESVIERSLMMPEEIAKMKGWWNATVNGKPLSGTNMFNRYDGQMPYVPSTTQGQVKLREVFERWGKGPLSLVTGDRKDTDQVELHIVASSNASDWVLHLVEQNKKVFEDGSPWRPYEEFWYKKVHGRWYGKGIAEKVHQLQLHLNEIINIRRNRSVVQQLGLFKIRNGSNITPQMISRLVTTGAIKVTDIEKDIAPLEFPQSGLEDSFNDEKQIIDWGQRNTGLYEVATGDELPASQPATTSAIQSQSAQSEFSLIKESLGMFLTRWLKYHALPVIVKNLKKGDIVRLTGEWNEVGQMDEWQVNKLLVDYIDEATGKGQAVSPELVAMEQRRALKKLQAAGNDRFFTLDVDFDPTDYDVEIMITNEEVNKSVLVQTIAGLIPMMPANQQMGALKQLYDLAGLDPNQLESTQGGMAQPQQSMQNPQQQPQQPQAQPMPQQIQRAGQPQMING